MTILSVLTGIAIVLTLGYGVLNGFRDASTPTDAEVEAAAKALVACVHSTAWDSLSEDIRNLNRGDARAALHAARNAGRADR